MIFTNVTGAGIYMQCCHREVAPGGSFVIPWLDVREDRAVRVAMRAGALAWKSEKGEPEVPGSPSERVAELEARRRERVEAESKAEAEAGAEAARRREADDAAVRENMSKMGNFDVPQVKPRKRVEAAVSREKPITRDDVISGDRPKSLSDIVRHNRAVKAFAGQKK